jgi:hypothetical protein
VFQVRKAGIEETAHLLKIMVACSGQPDLMLIGCFQITNNVADSAGKQLKPSFLCIRGLWLAIHA